METTKIGQLGEDKARDFLLKKGFSIRYQNWRHKRYEVDLICAKDFYLVFVEVKTRSTNYFGTPECFVTKEKRYFLTTAAQAYCDTYNYEGEIRFDIISISINKKNEILNLTHFEDAFYEIQ